MVDTTTKKNSDSGSPAPLAPDDITNRSNWILTATFGAILLSLLLSVPFLTPFLLAAPLAPYFYDAAKRGDSKAVFTFTLRWGLMVFACLSVLAFYFPGRTVASIPLAGQTIGTMSAWMDGTRSAAPLGPVSLLAGAAIIAAASLLSGGLGALVLGAGGLGCAASSFVYLGRHGENILEMIVLGNPPWIVALMAAGLFLLIPTALPFYGRLLGAAPPAARHAAAVRRNAFIGIALVVVGIACSILFGDAWRNLLVHNTIW